MFYFIGLALFLLAVMETVTHHFNESVFSKIKSKVLYEFFKSDWRRKYNIEEYWDKELEKNVKKFVKKKGIDYLFALIDAYHVSKWGMILSFSLAFDIVWYVPLFAALEWSIHRLFYTRLFMG